MKNILSIKQFNTKLGSIRLMAKVHKKTFDWGAIMNFQKHPTGRIALFFDLLIKAIITKTETYLKDSQNIILFNNQYLMFKIN